MFTHCLKRDGWMDCHVYSWLGSGPRYIICVTLFARCASQKTYCHAWHARIACYSRMAVGILTSATCKNMRQNLIPLATAYSWLCVKRRFSKMQYPMFICAVQLNSSWSESRLQYLVPSEHSVITELSHTNQISRYKLKNSGHF